jgi:pyrroline-5-carboxylate reductase
MVVGFAGSGNMSAGMARGWASAERRPERMLFTDAGSGRAAELAAEVGGERLASNAELAEVCDLLVLGVKPKDLDAVAVEAGAAPAVLSMLGATPVATVAQAFPASAAMRIMPNLGVEVGRGVMCFSAAPNVEEGLVSRVVQLLESLGRVVLMDDDLIDSATAVMGCSPAYLALVVEEIAAAGAHEGLDADLSRSLMVDTAAGTAELLRQRSPAELIQAVASPGGSTEAGLEALDREGARRAFSAAVEASLARMRGDA